jgi:hypothetical protein
MERLSQSVGRTCDNCRVKPEKKAAKSPNQRAFSDVAIKNQGTYPKRDSGVDASLHFRGGCC